MQPTDIAAHLLAGRFKFYEPPAGTSFVEEEPDYSAYTPEQRQRVEMAVEGITAALDAGYLRFKFYAVIKKRMRLAFGTRNTALFSYAFKGGGPPMRFGLVAYWDFLVPSVKGSQWRSFYIANVSNEGRGVLTWPNRPRGVLAGPNVAGNSVDMPSANLKPYTPIPPRWPGKPPELDAPDV